jgi:hypothetical protein
MTQEPTPLPLQPPQDSWFKRFTKQNEWLIDKMILALIGLVITWAGYELNKIQSQNQELKKSAEVAADKATDAAKKVDQAQTTALKTQVATEKVLVNTTGDPKDAKALAETKAALEQHIAATQETK